MSEVKATFGRGENPEFLALVKGELGWSQTNVYRFLHVHAMAQRGDFAKLEKSDLDLSVLYLLAAPNMPAEVIEAVAERSAEGARLSFKEARQMITEAKGQTLHYTRLKEPPPVAKEIEYVRLPEEPRAAVTITYERRETEDPERARVKTAAWEARRSLSTFARAARTHSSGAIIAALTDDERDGMREDIEAVNQFKAALDAELNIVPFPDKQS